MSEPINEEDTMKYINPVFEVTASDLEDNLYGSPIANRLRRELVGGGDWYWRYNFDTGSYTLTPIPRDRIGWGVWVAKPFEYTLRVGILFDRHQLRIYLWKRVIVFGKRDIDFLIESHV